MRVLVVDDSATIRKIVTGLLTKWGFDVAEAADGREALDRLQSATAATDLVLVDWNMPVMDGMTFVREVRAIAAYDQMPLMIMTTNTEIAQVSKALEEGANEYLMKPFTGAMIHEKLELLGFLQA
jgi:two-component system, chemotaxis family, chemotaxis protein CheY